MVGKNRSLGLIEVERAVAAIVIVVHHASSAARVVGEPTAARLLLHWGTLYHELVERPLVRILRARFLSRTAIPARDAASALSGLECRDEIQSAGIQPVVGTHEVVATTATPSAE